MITHKWQIVGETFIDEPLKWKRLILKYFKTKIKPELLVDYLAMT